MTQELIVADRPQQLLTIEPGKYVELVFEPFTKQLEDAKELAAKVDEFDVTTTAGMAVAVKHRALFRDIRIASEKARKERKAPILEIGKLLDSRYKAIEAEIEPFESRFDKAIKAEEARKDAERQAKIEAEVKRVAALQERVAELRGDRNLSSHSGSELIAQHVADLEAIPVDDSFQEFRQQAEDAKASGLSWLRELHAAAIAHEAEQARIQAEREELARLRAEQARREAEERARIAEEERQAKAARDAEAARQAEQLRRQREEEARAAAERQAIIDAENARVRAEQEEAAKIERERLAAERAEIERQQAEARRQREAQEAEARRLATQRAELERQQREAHEAEERRATQERARQERRQAMERREKPSPTDLAEAIATSFEVDFDIAAGWLYETPKTAWKNLTKREAA